MRAVVLVGGFGTRLRPLTLSTPKQMLPVVGVTMFERVIAALGRSGVDEAVISLGYRPDRFVEAFPDGTCAGVRLHYATEPEPLDTAGAIAFAARHAGIDDTFLACNGDVLTDLDYAWLVERHRAFGGEATLHLTPVDDPSRFGVVPTDPDGRVLEFIEKPAPGTAPTNAINAGTYVLEPEVLDRVGEGEKVSIERVVFPAIAADRRLFAVATDDYWLDAGTPEAYLRANLDLVDGHRAAREPAVAADASIAAGATVEASVVGAAAVVAEGACVRGSVVMDGATVEAGAVVEDSIVGRGARVGAGAKVRGLSMVADGAVVAAAGELDGGCEPPKERWGV